MFGLKKKELPVNVDLGEVTATIHLKNGSIIEHRVQGYTIDHWFRKADPKMWIERHVDKNMVNLKDRSIPLSEINEITFTTQSYYEEL